MKVMTNVKGKQPRFGRCSGAGEQQSDGGRLWRACQVRSSSGPRSRGKTEGRYSRSAQSLPPRAPIRRSRARRIGRPLPGEQALTVRG
ncbi:hypothetical protein AAFF_G00006580 [Aldrovandia affinis]|uniref:Uncharacterized protein n=1 Tax=Aldrovandia affinis TaxID=143900 RepID=A0AAD7X5N5_9TELE|nr:hypothetical protein AAFF_G00006580 [Aldrovandia affinis]